MTTVGVPVGRGRVDIEELKARSREVWGTGDYAPTSRQLEPASHQLLDALGVGDGDRVLDVAAGHGNCALAAARRGATVVASDFSPVMVAVGKGRTDAAGVEVQWREADAAELPFGDGAFDVVTSVFGAIFAPEQRDVAEQLVRVTTPGGRFGVTAWTPDGLTARMLAAGGPDQDASDRGPSDRDPPGPLAWGDAAHVAELFAGLPCDVELTERRIRFHYPSWEAWRRDLEAHGMTVVAKQTMPPDDYEQMFAEMRAVVEGAVLPGATGVTYDAEYVEVTGLVHTHGRSGPRPSGAGPGGT